MKSAFKKKIRKRFRLEGYEYVHFDRETGEIHFYVAFHDQQIRLQKSTLIPQTITLLSVYCS